MSTVVPELPDSPTAGSTIAPPKYRQELGDLARVSRPLVAYNLAYLALVLGVAGGAIAVFWAHPRWYTFALAFVVVSSRQQALLNVEHECIHGKLLPAKSHCAAVGYLCAGLVGSPFGASRNRHLTHHRLLATPEDPDRALHDDAGKGTRRAFTGYFLKGLVGGYAAMILFGPPPKDPGSGARRGRDIASIAVGQLIVAGALTIAFAWWVYPALWLAPLATVTALMHLVRSFAEHAITSAEREAHSNRLITIHSNAVERALLAPYNMNYHAEHHLVPWVPAPRLRSVHRRLEGREDLPPRLDRSSYGAAIGRYVRQLPR
jgi:fatty acid desaturase